MVVIKCGWGRHGKRKLNRSIPGLNYFQPNKRHTQTLSLPWPVEFRETHDAWKLERRPETLLSIGILITTGCWTRSQWGMETGKNCVRPKSKLTQRESLITWQIQADARNTPHLLAWQTSSGSHVKPGRTADNHFEAGSQTSHPKDHLAFKLAAVAIESWVAGPTVLPLPRGDRRGGSSK